MRCGISTACFYPEETLVSLNHVIHTGAPVTELFLNTFSELEDSYVEKLAATVKNSSTKMISLHPFSSAMEGFFFATRYKERVKDGMKLYRRYFELCAWLGIDKMVFHGDHAVNSGNFPLEEYAEQFCAVAKMGREYGVTLCHENVSYCRLGDPEVVKRIQPMLGEYAAFVLDTKQALRFGVSAEEMLTAMGKDIRHVHISDAVAENDCIPPGRGNEDFGALVAALQNIGYTGDLIIELYRDGFAHTEELVEGVRHIETLLA